MIKNIFAAVAACVCLTAAAQYPYKVIAPLHGVEDGDSAVLVNYDTGEAIDTVVVKDHTAVFRGELDEPYMARILANGNRMGSFILEQGTCALNPETRQVKGAYLNDQFNAILDSLDALSLRYANAETEEEAAACEAQYMDYMMARLDDNADNPIGYYLFLEYCYMADAGEMLAAIEKYPDMASFVRVQKLVAAAERKMSTSPGKPFVDFEVEYDGKTYKLSDYVGRGKPVLVDFWASWCRPCIQEINGSLKEIYAKYADNGLDVLGVAVWDEPQNTLKAIERFEIPWQCVINAQTIPTDAYGISGIPCIILFAPDGTIISRDLQGATLVKAVDAAMSEWGNEQ